MIAARGNARVAGHDPRRDAPVILVILGVATRADEQPALVVHHFEDRREILHVVLVAGRALEQRIAGEVAAVQEGHVARIDAAFHGLQPVALLDALGHERLVERHRAELVLGLRGLLFRRTHVGPQHAALFDQRIGLQLDLLGVAGFLRLGRDVHALAGHVELPAVIGAAQAAFLVAAEPQRDAAVGAELVDEAELALGIAEGDETLAEQLQAHRRAIGFRQFLAEKRRHPVATEEIAHRRSRVRLRQIVVLFLAKHETSPLTPLPRPLAQGGRQYMTRTRWAATPGWLS